jgi:hypothetical protein
MSDSSLAKKLQIKCGDLISNVNLAALIMQRLVEV